ncbi:glycosyltransferase [Proteinivorax hydrogeniformans]|uniref:Glycosyltransferase n=1 Tax=Proteinivorax hydrogeniformans TaxID=1826727 RepID=A0AAU8HWW4_9FIRM
MKKVIFLISHIPNPRILKRIKAIESDFGIYLVYWDRGQELKEDFEIDSRHEVVKIQIDAPFGNPVKRLFPLMRFVLTALHQLKTIKPDTIHAGNLDMLLISIIYKKIYNNKVQVVYEVGDLPKYAFIKSGYSPKKLVPKTLQVIERVLTKDISKLIVTSPYFWNEYFSSFVDHNKYLFIPNAPFKSLFASYKSRENKVFTIGFVGSVRYVEQLKMLIDAAEELGGKVKVLIAGSGTGYEHVLNYTAEKSFVECYGPYNYEKEIVQLYEKVDCSYSVYDTKLENVTLALPNRLYESIVCHVPIIGAKGTALGEFINKNKIGVTVDSTDKEELNLAIMKLVCDEDLVREYKENCIKIKEDFYYENSSKKLLSEYKRINAL